MKKKLSGRMLRTSRLQLIDYKMGPQKGAIHVGRGLSKVAAIDDARKQGYRVFGQGQVLTLH